MLVDAPPRVNDQVGRETINVCGRPRWRHGFVQAGLIGGRLGNIQCASGKCLAQVVGCDV